MHAGRQARPWKGLDTRRQPQFLGYEATERMLAALLPEAARWRPDIVVGIARGGLVPATMAATTLALPLASLAYDCTAERPIWLGPPPVAGRVLLVDDGCSSGRTMSGARAALLAEGRACLTLAVVHDPDCALYVPDLSHPMQELWRFPWERGEATPPARAWRAEADGRRQPAGIEAPFLAVDFAVAARRAAAGDALAGLPLLDPDRVVIVSAVPEQERPRIGAWLARAGYARLDVFCRPEGFGDDAGSIAGHKAAVATRLGCTHLIEAAAEQAIRIAALAPHLAVMWWSADEDRSYIVGSASAPRASGEWKD
jgi:hypoxanthine phosphoribosyltransferase